MAWITMSDSKGAENKYAALVKVRGNGKLSLEGKDAVDIWQDFQADFWQNQMTTIGLSGNRNALRAKFALYKNFLSQQNRTQAYFYRMARMQGYSGSNTDTIQELWNDFIEIWQPEFISWLKQKMVNGSSDKKSNSDEITFG